MLRLSLAHGRQVANVWLCISCPDAFMYRYSTVFKLCDYLQTSICYRYYRTYKKIAVLDLAIINYLANFGKPLPCTEVQASHTALGTVEIAVVSGLQPRPPPPLFGRGAEWSSLRYLNKET
jgi:hypothetical protein